MRSAFLRVFVAAALLIACREEAPRLPPGVECGETLAAGPDEASLLGALGRAQAGDCVVAAAGTYRSALIVPAGVALVAESGATVVVEGGPEHGAAITLSAGTSLVGIRVVGPADIGVLIDRGPAKLDGVVVEQAGSIGVAAWCEEDCRGSPLSELHDVELSGNRVGLWARGAGARVIAGRVAESRCDAGIACGYGVVASHGAVLQMEDTLVEQNEQLGILVDGALGTEATLQRATVRDNRNRGIWIQGLLGSDQAPKVQLESCTLESNGLVGLGARASTGIRVRGGRIASTVMVKAPTGLAALADVGDGIGLFEGTGAVRVEDVALELNERSQVLVDKGAAGLVVQGGRITAGAGQFGIVVQRTSEQVQAPTMTVPAAGDELPFSAPLLQIPNG